ncbi:MAG: HIT family hydrolase [Thermoprotei archaeon]|nr:MAG: HIT family hydrolase [Thermoprotei archaeon]RLE99118.1 MAG: HIT family hydrolase [Thermoprotei archaeon]
MDRLWAPWRMKYVEYVSIEKPKGCFLCNAAKTSNLREKLVLYRNELVLAMMNLYPYNTGHLLLAPLRHIGDFEELSDEEVLALGRLTKKCIKVIKEALKPDGFNIGINIGRVAGAGLEDHIHIHIIPRWNGDTNFMPLIASTKVIPEAIYDTYDKLMRVLEKLQE